MSSILDRQIMSLYITLLLSMGCLGYAELGQELRETPFLYSLLFIAMGLAYWAEGKLSLSIAASNSLAVVLIMGGFGWIVLKMQTNQSAFEPGSGLVRTIVSYTGPVLCALMLAKLFRPKSTSDQWLLQLLGLVQVILASVLAMSSRMDRDAPLFPVLMLLYLASLSWSIRLFYLRGEVDQTSAEMKQSAVSLGWFSFIPVGWFLFCMLIAVIIFFCLPQGGIDASLLQGVDSTDNTATSNIDLNADGTVQISEERVMRIEARNKNGSVLLPETLRLRGAILCDYNERSKVWGAYPSSISNPQKMLEFPGQLSDDSIRLEYNIDVAQIQEMGKPRQARYTNNYIIPLFLTDPPHRNQFDSRSFSSPGRNSLQPTLNVNPFEGQCWVSLTQKMSTISLTHDYSGHLNATEWDQTLQYMPAEYSNYMIALSRVPRSIDASGRVAKFSQDVLEKAKLAAGANDREKALALERHLSVGEFTYSLNRRKQDTTIDPTEDFLFNVKEGHCERYASALVMMLRSIGIKSRIIIGYRGLEWNELGGFYIVRQSHVHAWVEALIGQEILADGSHRLRWLVLDPTPMTDARSAESSFASPLTFARYLWEFFILDFSGQAQRTKLMAQLKKTSIGRFITWWLSLNAWQAISLLVGFVCVFVVSIWLLVRWWKIRQRRRLEPTQNAGMVIPFYSRLLKLLSRRGWKPQPGQTPAEFATQVQHELQLKKRDDLADIPQAIVPPYYAVRFGGINLDEQMTNSLEQQLDVFQAGLKHAT